MARLLVVIDRSSGVAELRKAAWSIRVPVGDLDRWRALYRRLAARGARRAGEPGPWARFYVDDLRALERAIGDVGEEVSDERS